MAWSQFLLFAFLGAICISLAVPIAAQLPAELLPPENVTSTTPTPIEGDIPAVVPGLDEPSVAIPITAPLPAEAPISSSPQPPEDTTCIGERPASGFRCNGGRWTFIGDLTIGPGQMVLHLNISGPSYVLGRINVTEYGRLKLLPPLLNSTLQTPVPGPWNPKKQSLLTVSECFDPLSFPPQIALLSPTYYKLPLYTESSYTFWGIDTSCNSTASSVRWNHDFFDAQPVLSDTYCWTFIDQFRTFPSETDPARWVSRIRLQWRYLCSPYKTTSPSKGDKGGLIAGIIVATLIGGAGVAWLGCVVYGCIRGCCCSGFAGGNGGDGGGGYEVGGGSSWDNSSSNNNDSYGTFSGGGDSGGGGGGSSWASSSAGNWD